MWRSNSARHGAARGMGPLLALALALVALSVGMLAAPVAAAAGGLPPRLTATNTPAATDTPTATDTPAATPTATDTPAPTATATLGPTPTATPPPNPYNLDISAAISEAGWPQQYSNWCGVATVAAIADYVNPSAGVTQQGVLNALNDPTNASEWGYPTPGGWGPYLPADIARDFGTDPRSLAEGLTLATGHQYHVVVDTHGAWDTTIHIVDDLLISKQPVSVFVDHGQHSIVVSGVDATSNPLQNPNSITAIHVWDPGGGVNWVGIQPHLEETVPISLWLSGTINWSGSDYFKYPYSDNMYQSKPLDPDPAVGPYTFQPARFNHMWVGHYVYLTPVTSSAASALNADWEVTPGGALYAGYATSQYPAIPVGYSGPTVPMPTNPPPPPPPVRPPKPAPKLPPPPPPTPTPRPTATLRPRATPIPYMTPDPTSPNDAPNATVCVAARCAFDALLSGPALIVIALLVVILLGMALFAPTILPGLLQRGGRIGERDRAVRPAAIAPPAALLPALPEALPAEEGEPARDDEAVPEPLPSAAAVDAPAEPATGASGEIGSDMAATQAEPAPEATANAAIEATPAGAPETEVTEVTSEADAPQMDEPADAPTSEGDSGATDEESPA